MKNYKQETNESCGVACLRSILNSFGNGFSEEDIWKRYEPFKSKTGVFLKPIMCLGVTALKFGFKATYIGYNPIIANRNHFDSLKESLKKKSKTNFDYGKFLVDEALRFLKLGGKLKIEILNIKKIKKLVDENKFVLVEIKPAFVNHKSPIGQNHKVIVIGYTKKGFKILDPSDAKEHLWDFDTFLLAFYAAVPELLVIKKKK